MKLILDVECTRQKNPITGKDDPSPYNSNNNLVTVQYKNIDTGEKEVFVLYHKEFTNERLYDKIQKLRYLLDNAELIIGHNIKFDIQWLLACDFKYNGKLYDTMIFEYVCAKGMKTPLSLKDLAIKYGLPLKSDILQAYWEAGVNTDAIPLAELTEYALQDIETTHELYKLQCQKMLDNEEVKFMLPAIQLTNEALWGIIEMERNGCCIDKVALEEVATEYNKELEQLEKGIKLMVGELMGDTPINLASPDDMSRLLYGMEFKNIEAKRKWTEVLNIGTDERGAVKKKRYPKRLTKTEFKDLKRDCLQTVYRTNAIQCQKCYGNGKIRKIKKDGKEYKKDSICPECAGKRFIYVNTTKRAGLRIRMEDTYFATAAGFAADKKIIEKHVKESELADEEKSFLKALERYSAITSYLSTFVEGMRNNVREDGYLHTNLNQCITATGRLSSSGPNFQNLPRGNTFPVRKAIKSRFTGGYILEVDFAQLEYRTAVLLAKCPVGLQSILEGKDRHQITAEILYGSPKHVYESDIWKKVRQAAKPHTFKPLYGGQTGTEAEQTYYKAFLEEHTGIARWHDELCNEAIKNKQIKTPTGRIFAFPTASRQNNGRVTRKTQIVNYPVQAVATADIIWIVLIDLLYQMQQELVKSKLILQVHDSAILDVHPEEREKMLFLVKKSFDKVHEFLYTRYGLKTPVPIDSEMSIGSNWNDKTEIKAA